MPPEGLNSHDLVAHIEEFGKYKAECAERFGKYDSDIKTLFRRVDKQEQILETLKTLNTSVGTMKNDLTGLRKDFDELKLAPYKKWQKIGFELLKYVVLLGAGIIAGRLGLA